MIAPHCDIASLKAAIPLTSIIGQVVDLRRSSGGEMVGLCPFHQESNPSFSVNDAKGVYHCFGCGASGDVFDFLREQQGLDFQEALGVLSDASPIGNGKPPPPSKPSKGDEEKARWAKEIWDSSRSIKGTIAEDYLASRSIILDELPELPALRFGWFPCRGLRGERPALVAAFTDIAGHFVSIQRTFLTLDGLKIDREYPNIEPKQCLAKSRGHAIKFGDDPTQIVLVEGVEDALSVLQKMPGSTVWATAGAEKIPKTLLPPECGTVVLAPDNDAAGRKAISAATPIYQRQGMEVVVDLPPEGHDWNSLLMKEAAHV